MTLEEYGLSRTSYLYSWLAAKQDREQDAEFRVRKTEFLQIATAELCFRTVRYLYKTYNQEEMRDVRSRFILTMDDEWAYYGLGSRYFNTDERSRMKSRLIASTNPEILLKTLLVHAAAFNAQEVQVLLDTFMKVAYAGYAERGLRGLALTPGQQEILRAAI